MAIKYKVQVLLSNRSWIDKSDCYNTKEAAESREKFLLNKGWYTRVVEDSGFETNVTKV